jgi:LAS superfamily LD-carboxypeptidase LdcB
MSTLKGKYYNGKIPKKELVVIDTGQYLEDNAARSFSRMKIAAKKDGIDIELSGKNSGYRECGQQGDYTKGLSDGKFTQWFAWEKYKAGKGNLAANPTTSVGCKSNHGWGIAIDVSGSKAKDWIKKNGVDYGWLWYTKDGGEGQRINENWHFNYNKEKDTFINKNNKNNKKRIINTILYSALGLSVVGLAYGFYRLTREK